MSAAFCLSGVVTLSNDHRDFFEVLGISASSVMTSEQFQVCINEAERVLLVMTDDPRRPSFRLARVAHPG
jgi:hypothetical protein